MKLGGLGMRHIGLRLRGAASVPVLGRPGSGVEAVDRDLHRGVRRRVAACSESNFPVDKAGHAYAVGWNAMKRLAAGASAEEKADLFWRTAARAYRLDISDIMRKGDTRSAHANTKEMT